MGDTLTTAGASPEPVSGVRVVATTFAATLTSNVRSGVALAMKKSPALQRGILSMWVES